MKTTDRRSAIQCAVRSALVAAAAAVIAAPASAQDESIQEIVVTGTRIQRTDFTSDSPVASVNAEVLGETGAISIERVLNQLPQFVPSVSTSSNNPANAGQANLDLRGLGTNRNLVLLNGRRLPPSNSNGTVDVNIVPAALIERVEVVTGGASAVYGSDAIAGVTNFALKKNFGGAEFQTGFGETALRDGREWNAAFTLGSNFADDRGSAVISLQYSERDQILQGDREFSEVVMDVRRSGSVPQGSPTITEGIYSLASNNSHTQAAMDQVFARYGFAPGVVSRTQEIGFNADGTLFTTGNGVPGSNSVANFRGNTDLPGFSPDAYSYNFGPPNLLSRPMERWNLAMFGDLDVSEKVNAYTQVFYTTYESLGQIAPVPAGNITIPVTNPFIPEDLRTLLASRPNPGAAFNYRQRMEGVGPRQTFDEYDVYQFLAGFNGSVGSAWHWDVYAATSRMNNATLLNNDMSRSRLQGLLNATDGGVGTCAGGYNPFTGPVGLSAACGDYVRSYFTNRTTLDHTMAEATFGGRAFEMPAGEARFSIGAAWREEKYAFKPDLAVSRGDLVGFNRQSALDGYYNVGEFFGELYLPLLTDLSLAKSVSVTLGARASDYSTIGSAEAFKAEGNWQPVDSVRFRASWQQAVRAPSIAELFSPSNQNFPPLLEDPCSVSSAVRTNGPNADAANGGNGGIRALCVAQGIPEANIDSFSFNGGQIETFGGGNPDLQEESANTITFGVVFDSPWSGVLGDLRASIDYYDIRLKDAIFSVPAGEIALLCYGFQGNNPGLDPNDPSCQALNRRTQSNGTASNGTAWVPSQGTDNVSELNTSGIDVQVDWGLDLGNAGRLNLNMLSSWLGKWEVQYLPTVPRIDFTGTIGDSVGSAYPDYKLFFNADWNRGPLGVGLRVRHLPEMENKYASYDPFTTVGVEATTYLDANVSWQFGEGINLLIGVENLGDTEPPQYTSFIEMGTDPSTYDVLGRRYFARANVRF